MSPPLALEEGAACLHEPESLGKMDVACRWVRNRTFLTRMHFMVASIASEKESSRRVSASSITTWLKSLKSILPVSGKAHPFASLLSNTNKTQIYTFLSKSLETIRCCHGNIHWPVQSTLYNFLHNIGGNSRITFWKHEFHRVISLPSSVLQ